MLDPDILCAAWNLPSLRASTLAEHGTIHRTHLLDMSDDSRYVLRAYRHTAENYDFIVQEHRLCVFVREHGLPAVAPLPLSTGATILKHEGRYYALFPFAEGSQTPRGHFAPREITAMGRFLGKLHHVLQTYPYPPLDWRDWELERTKIFVRLDVIIHAIQMRDQLAEDDQRELSRLMQKRSWLMAAQSVDMTAFQHLEKQLIHGDYQETNLFFFDDEVSAIIDWDQAYVAPRAWEVVRALHYVGKLDPAFCQIFLAAYRQIHNLSSEELECAASVYGWMYDHGLWVAEELYLHGNERVRVFLEPGDTFVPFVERWAALAL